MQKFMLISCSCQKDLQHYGKNYRNYKSGAHSQLFNKKNNLDTKFTVIEYKIPNLNNTIKKSSLTNLATVIISKVDIFRKKYTKFQAAIVQGLRLCKPLFWIRQKLKLPLHFKYSCPRTTNKFSFYKNSLLSNLLVAVRFSNFTFFQ